MDDPAAHFFSCTDRERAIFEAGIKLGSIFHQYVGVPLNTNNMEAVEKAIKESVMVQPFVKDATVIIDRKKIEKRKGQYKYVTLSGEMMDISVKICYGESCVTGRMKYVPEMDYPLMYLEE
jgi:hypothetical protein